MKKLLILWLVSVSALAQTPNRPLELNYSGYLGNPIETTLTLAPSDTSQVITARALESDVLQAAKVSPQPTLSRDGLNLKITFPASNLVKAFVEVKVGSLVRFAGWLLASKTPTPTRSLTVVQYITLKGDTGPAGPKGDTGDPATNLVQSVAGRQGAVQLMFADLISHPGSLAGYGITDAYTKTQTYTQAEVTTLLQGYYLRVTVATKALANAAAAGPQPKIITVTTDESDGNRTNKYIYDGDNQPLQYPLF
ncbi:hypothetical protein G8759_31395 [Spirosoma aureum]|uniref:Uncharacterized protein n=1 Tax=Spirosoma aureum TaxID=2692134 RepID=A0A6G9AWN9_9BACT|nr:hypothetical protein [Spirosoma aureum]QIP16830.1 hypothetical protein G8759_31395 [Spirosoma aureum]